MAPESRGLASYIENIHYGEDFLSHRKSIFDHGITHRSPCLEPYRTNRILVFAGSFNPPHLGHFELLRHGFTRSGRDMNIIAAIVLPLDDECLARKLRGKENALVFTKAERVRLWNGYVPSDWFWTYDRSLSEWCEFQRRLTRAITKDGFDVSWVALCGPDYVQVDWVPPTPVWGCKDILVSDVGRPADFTSRAVNRLTSLRGCEAWEEIVQDSEAIQKYAEEGTSWVYSGLFMMSSVSARRMLGEDFGQVKRMVNLLFEEAVQQVEANRICRRRDDPESTIRFIPMESRMMEMSSTRVRELIESNLQQVQLPRELQQLVLYPEILLDLISRKYLNVESKTSQEKRAMAM